MVDINNRKFINYLWIIVSSLILFKGCSLAYYNSDKVKNHDEIIYDEDIVYHENDFEVENNSFYGVWILEKVLFNLQHIGENQEDLYGIPVNVEDYLGYELELSSEFVRLGNRRMYEPEYSKHLSGEGGFFLNHEVTWESDYFETISDFIDYFNEKNQNLGEIVADSNYPHFRNILISYPNPQFFQGVHLDPDFNGYRFNPLFQHITILNDDYILVGTNIRVLARRGVE